MGRVDVFDANTPAGSIAFDGEREVTFGPDDEVLVTLRDGAFRTIDIEACMAHAATHGCFTTSGEPHTNLKQVKGG